MPLTPDPDRRLDPRRPTNARGVVVAPHLELACVIADESAGGLKLRLDRAVTLPREVVVVQVATAQALTCRVVWQKGQEAGVRLQDRSPLRGLVPARLTPARDAWLRAGER